MIELGEIIDGLIFLTAEKKPVVRHVTMKQKEAYARMKQIQVSVIQYLEMTSATIAIQSPQENEVGNKSPDTRSKSYSHVAASAMDKRGHTEKVPSTSKEEYKWQKVKPKP